MPINKEIDRWHKQAEIEAALNQPTSKALTNSPTGTNPPVRPLLIPQPLENYRRVKTLMRKTSGK